MTFKNGDIVKFKGSKKGIHYRVVDSNEFLAQSRIENEIVPHVRIEVLGDVAIKYLEPIQLGEKGVMAIDVKMRIHNQNN